MTTTPCPRLRSPFRAAASLLPAAALLGVLLVALLTAPAAGAAEVEIFQTNSQSSFLAGSLEGISVDSLGRLRLADRVDRLTAIDEPFLLAAADHPEGWVVGTGNDGRVLLVRRSGEVEELFATEEPQVFAVAAEADGTVWAAGSPRGKLYRLAPDGGEAEVWFDPGETYVWAIEPGFRDGLLLATGTQGRLFHVTAKGVGSIVYDSDDTHLRSLLVLPQDDPADGGVLVGTAGEGWIQHLTPPARRGGGDGEWRVRTLYDASEPEVVALALAPDGTRYAAVAASEASLVDLGGGATGSAASAPGEDEDEDEDGGEPGATVTVSSSGSPSTPAATGSRRAGYRGPRSEVLQISPAGVVESLWEFEEETVFDLLFHRGRLWVATGMDGELYAWNGDQMVLEKDVDERQVVALLPDAPGPAFATTNAAALFRVAGGTERQGVYTSAALDADQIARFGTFRWRGEVPRGGSVEASFRSGVSAEPDRTWSEWTGWQRVAPDDERGGEVALGDVPRGRYAQYRVRLRAGDGRSPLLYGTELSYRQENLRPDVESLEVLEPGQILVPANFNPGTQAFEPASPRPGGVFTTLEESTGPGDPRLKTLWKPGYRALRWSVEDANGDDLLYALAVRPAGLADEDGDGQDDGAGGGGWMSMVEELEETHWVFDARVLPDGVYRFRLQATDLPSNPDGAALAVERLTEPVVVDHSAPALVEVERVAPDRLRVTVSDDWSPLVEARLSVDAKEWRDLRPRDGLLDGRGETFLVEVPEGARLVLLQVRDAAYNEVTHDLLSRD